MRTLGEAIRARRVSLGLSLGALAARARCAKGYLSQIENDRRTGLPSPEMIGRLEVALAMEAGSLLRLRWWAGTPEAERRRVLDLERSTRRARRLAALVGGSDLDEAYRSGELSRLVEALGGAGAPPGTTVPAPGGVRGSGDGSGAGGVGALTRVPLINKVAAGYPREFTDLGYPARVADEYVGVPGVTDPDAFAARVVGDSMSPGYAEGDVVVFSPMADARSGSDCFVRLERDAEATFKRVVFDAAPGAPGAVIRLQPLNGRYPARSLPREEVAGVYPAVFVLRAASPGGRGEASGG